VILVRHCGTGGTYAQITVHPDGERVRTRGGESRGQVEHDGAGVLATDSPDSPDSSEEGTTGWLRDAAVAVPVQPGRLPDGRPSLIIGDVRDSAAFNHLQGDNPEHDRGDCGIVSCAEVLSQFGLRLTETEAFPARNALPRTASGAGTAGSVRLDAPGRASGDTHRLRCPGSRRAGQLVERLAVAVQGGHGVIAMVNAGVLCSDPQALGHGQANHAVTITGVARDSYDGVLLGFYINDSGQSGQFVSAHLMTTAFEHEGGFCIVTDSARAAG